MIPVKCLHNVRMGDIFVIKNVKARKGEYHDEVIGFSTRGYPIVHLETTDSYEDWTKREIFPNSNFGYVKIIKKEVYDRNKLYS